MWMMRNMNYNSVCDDDTDDDDDDYNPVNDSDFDNYFLPSSSQCHQRDLNHTMQSICHKR